MFRFALPALAACLLPALPESWAASPPAPPIPSVALAGTAHVGGFHAGSAELQLEVRDGRYSVRFNAESEGWIRLFFRWGFELQARGTLETVEVSELRPIEYLSKRYHRDGHVERHVRFRAGIAETVLPPGVDPYPHPVPSEERVRVLDPASALLAAGLTLARTGRCEQTIRVFDGKTRSDMVLTDSDTGRAGAPGIGTKQCTFDMRRIAGFSERRLHKPPVRGEIWFRPYREGLMVPTRLETRTRVGMAIFRFELPAG